MHRVEGLVLKAIIIKSSIFGIPMSFVADYFGCSESIVQRIYKELGIAKMSQRQKIKLLKEIQKELDQIKEMAEKLYILDTHRPELISELLGVSSGLRGKFLVSSKKTEKDENGKKTKK